MNIFSSAVAFTYPTQISFNLIYFKVFGIHTESFSLFLCRKYLRPFKIRWLSIFKWKRVTSERLREIISIWFFIYSMRVQFHFQASNKPLQIATSHYFMASVLRLDANTLSIFCKKEHPKSNYKFKIQTVNNIVICYLSRLLNIM